MVGWISIVGWLFLSAVVLSTLAFCGWRLARVVKKRRKTSALESDIGELLWLLPTAISLVGAISLLVIGSVGEPLSRSSSGSIWWCNALLLAAVISGIVNFPFVFLKR